MSHFFLTAALARLGLLPEACSEARTGLAINPTFSIPRFRASTPSDNPTAVAGRERIIDGLRKAGVSEANAIRRLARANAALADVAVRRRNQRS